MTMRREVPRHGDECNAMARRPAQWGLCAAFLVTLTSPDSASAQARCGGDQTEPPVCRLAELVAKPSPQAEDVVAFAPPTGRGCPRRPIQRLEWEELVAQYKTLAICGDMTRRCARDWQPALIGEREVWLPARDVREINPAGLRAILPATCRVGPPRPCVELAVGAAGLVGFLVARDGPPEPISGKTSAATPGKTPKAISGKTRVTAATDLAPGTRLHACARAGTKSLLVYQAGVPLLIARSDAAPTRAQIDESYATNRLQRVCRVPVWPGRLNAETELISAPGPRDRVPQRTRKPKNTELTVFGAMHGKGNKDWWAVVGTDGFLWIAPLKNIDVQPGLDWAFPTVATSACKDALVTATVALGETCRLRMRPDLNSLALASGTQVVGGSANPAGRDIVIPSGAQVAIGPVSGSSIEVRYLNLVGKIRRDHGCLRRDTPSRPTQLLVASQQTGPAFVTAATPADGKGIGPPADTVAALRVLDLALDRPTPSDASFGRKGLPASRTVAAIAARIERGDAPGEIATSTFRMLLTSDDVTKALRQSLGSDAVRQRDLSACPARSRIARWAGGPNRLDPFDHPSAGASPLPADGKEGRHERRRWAAAGILAGDAALRAQLPHLAARAFVQAVDHGQGTELATCAVYGYHTAFRAGGNAEAAGRVFSRICRPPTEESPNLSDAAKAAQAAADEENQRNCFLALSAQVRDGQHKAGAAPPAYPALLAVASTARSWALLGAVAADLPEPADAAYFMLNALSRARRNGCDRSTEVAALLAVQMARAALEIVVPEAAWTALRANRDVGIAEHLELYATTALATDRPGAAERFLRQARRDRPELESTPEYWMLEARAKLDTCDLPAAAEAASSAHRAAACLLPDPVSLARQITECGDDGDCTGERVAACLLAGLVPLARRVTECGDDGDCTGERVAAWVAAGHSKASGHSRASLGDDVQALFRAGGICAEFCAARREQDRLAQLLADPATAFETLVAWREPFANIVADYGRRCSEQVRTRLAARKKELVELMDAADVILLDIYEAEFREQDAAIGAQNAALEAAIAALSRDVWAHCGDRYQATLGELRSISELAGASKTWRSALRLHGADVAPVGGHVVSAAQRTGASPPAQGQEADAPGRRALPACTLLEERGDVGDRALTDVATVRNMIAELDNLCSALEPRSPAVSQAGPFAQLHGDWLAAERCFVRIRNKLSLSAAAAKTLRRYVPDLYLGDLVDPARSGQRDDLASAATEPGTSNEADKPPPRACIDYRRAGWAEVLRTQAVREDVAAVAMAAARGAARDALTRDCWASCGNRFQNELGALSSSFEPGAGMDLWRSTFAPRGGGVSGVSSSSSTTVPVAPMTAQAVSAACAASAAPSKLASGASGAPRASVATCVRPAGATSVQEEPRLTAGLIEALDKHCAPKHSSVIPANADVGFIRLRRVWLASEVCFERFRTERALSAATADTLRRYVPGLYLRDLVAASLKASSGERVACRSPQDCDPLPPPTDAYVEGSMNAWRAELANRKTTEHDNDLAAMALDAARGAARQALAHDYEALPNTDFRHIFRKLGPLLTPTGAPVDTRNVILSSRARGDGSSPPAPGLGEVARASTSHSLDAFPRGPQLPVILVAELDVLCAPERLISRSAAPNNAYNRLDSVSRAADSCVKQLQRVLSLSDAATGVLSRYVPGHYLRDLIGPAGGAAASGHAESGLAEKDVDRSNDCIAARLPAWRAELDKQAATEKAK